MISLEWIKNILHQHVNTRPGDEPMEEKTTTTTAVRKQWNNAECRGIYTHCIQLTTITVINLNGTDFQSVCLFFLSHFIQKSAHVNIHQIPRKRCTFFIKWLSKFEVFDKNTIASASLKRCIKYRWRKNRKKKQKKLRYTNTVATRSLLFNRNAVSFFWSISSINVIVLSSFAMPTVNTEATEFFSVFFFCILLLRLNRKKASSHACFEWRYNTLSVDILQQ